MSLSPPVAMTAFSGCLSFLQRLLIDKQLLSLGNVSIWTPSDCADPGSHARLPLVVDGKTLENLEVRSTRGWQSIHRALALSHACGHTRTHTQAPRTTGTRTAVIRTTVTRAHAHKPRKCSFFIGFAGPDLNMCSL
eukprot:158940-Pleurochrysis_carterae.AAC.2